MFRTLVVPLDGSRFAENALVTASDLARRTHARLELLYVHESLPARLTNAGAAEEYLRGSEAAYLEEVASRTAALCGSTLGRRLRDGVPSEEIAVRAGDCDQPLIIMASHGRTGFSRMWLGSVTDAVVRHAKVPVLIVRPKEPQPPAPELPLVRQRIRRILVPLDGSPFAEEILPHAVALAQATGAGLALMQVVVPYTTVGSLVGIPDAYPIWDDVAVDALAQRAEDYLARQASSLRSKSPAVGVTTEVRVGDTPAATIGERARVNECDVVALATHGRGATRLVVGSVADKVIRGTSGAILVVRPPHRTGQTEGDTNQDAADVSVQSAPQLVY